jgi:hypothetical protein
MNDRITAELDLLRRYYPDLEYREEGRWVLLPRYTAPETIWEQSEIALCFQIPPAYPGQKPYGFYVRPRIRLKSGATINNAGESSEPPFPGEWLKFSWDVPDWRPTADLQTGANLLNYVLTIQARLAEGA